MFVFRSFSTLLEAFECMISPLYEYMVRVGIEVSCNGNNVDENFLP